MRVSVRNVSTVIKDIDVNRFIHAVAQVLVRDFEPAWGVVVTSLHLMAKDELLAPGAYELVIANDSDQIGALGYHELSAIRGPIGFVFAKTSMADGSSWTVTASHELWEMLADPWINDVVEIDHTDGTTEFRPKEVSDACENDEYAIKVRLADGGLPVLISDFVLPEYFRPTGPPEPKYDVQGLIKNPLELLPGGYTLSLIAGSGTGWTQISAQTKATSRRSEMVMNGGKKILPGSRRQRRMLPDAEWKPSSSI